MQPKAITFPTDAKLLHAAIKGLNRLARKHGIRLRQSYLRIAKTAAMMASRYAHAKQFRRHQRQLRLLRSRLGRIIRDIRRKIEGQAVLENAFALPLGRASQIRSQQQRQRGFKLYSFHAPQVECIGKGKAAAPYEFGVQASNNIPTRTPGRTSGNVTCQNVPAESPRDSLLPVQASDRCQRGSRSRRSQQMARQDKCAPARSLPDCRRGRNGRRRSTPIATTMTGTTSGERMRPVASTRRARGRRAIPIAASVPRLVESMTTATATQTLGQVASSQSALPKYARYHLRPNAGGGKDRYVAEENETVHTTTIEAREKSGSA